MRSLAAALSLAAVLLLSSAVGGAAAFDPNFPWADEENATVHRIVLSIDKFYLDGIARPITGFNMSSPGPTIEVTEGDWISATIINNMEDENSTVHWHGMLMHETPYNDGVTGVTQCPIKSGGGKITYNFKATPAGTYWYHGHYHLQFPNGLIGAMIVHPRDGEPYTYDDEWTWMISDWYNMETMEMAPYYLSEESDGVEPTPDAIQVNGAFNVPATERYLVYNTSYNDVVRVRVINAGGFSMFNVSVDGMTLDVIEVDGTPVEKYTVNWFLVNCAQRTSFLLDFSQLSLDENGERPKAVYWRVTAMVEEYPFDATSARPPYEPNYYPYAPPVFFNHRYMGVVDLVPEDNRTIPAYSYDTAIPVPPGGHPYISTNLIGARPLLPAAAPSPTHFVYMEVEFTDDDTGVERGYWNHVTYPQIQEDSPPVLYQYLSDPQTIVNPLIPPGEAVGDKYVGIIRGNSASHYDIPAGAIVDLFINNTDTGEHPMHLHGHLFYVIRESGYPDYEGTHSDNPMRRDVISVPAGGWVLVRYVANNPGVWAFHCHIDWHMAAGLVALFIEGSDQLSSERYMLPDDHNDWCTVESSGEVVTESTETLSPTAVSIVSVVLAFLAGALLSAAVMHRLGSSRGTVNPRKQPSSSSSPLLSSSSSSSSARAPAQESFDLGHVALNNDD